MRVCVPETDSVPVTDSESVLSLVGDSKLKVNEGVSDFDSVSSSVSRDEDTVDEYEKLAVKLPVVVGLSVLVCVMLSVVEPDTVVEIDPNSLLDIV